MTEFYKTFEANKLRREALAKKEMERRTRILAEVRKLSTSSPLVLILMSRSYDYFLVFVLASARIWLRRRSQPAQVCGTDRGEGESLPEGRKGPENADQERKA